MRKHTISLYLPSLRGGGAERVMLNLARGFAENGHVVDLVLAKAEGPYLNEVPKDIRIVDLNASRVLKSFPGLIRYLRKERPLILLSALVHANIIALWAQKISRVSTRVVVSIHNSLSISSQNATSIHARLMPQWVRIFYSWADLIIAVSHGVAEDLITLTNLPRGKIKVIYNPIVTPELTEDATGTLTHPWFTQKDLPVILGVGRLNKQKDFPTLIRAFNIVRKKRSARLLILGEGEERSSLEAMIQDLGLSRNVQLYGFVDNPYAYMARASVFVLSSAWEGFGNVLVEAMACGCPVVSTNCPSGPSEILENGKYGSLVPVGNAEALAQSIISILDAPPDPLSLQHRAAEFSLDNICEQYLELIL